MPPIDIRTMTAADFYARTEFQRAEVKRFMFWAAHEPHLDHLWFPNKARAPWLVSGLIRHPGGGTVRLEFYPHLGKIHSQAVPELEKCLAGDLAYETAVAFARGWAGQ